ncbi:hypothetical protein Pcinc_007607 [Petrolisthes cinctipes]|uniref:Uncharacterized protein n=1 Tax=Petrolisthes cinctipes TaxID=88211 RepID=A0AAE1GAQ9_PETCI|nr:hypothetical protein Pcinc_007607 [Petrolisthes cinctipes]
MDNMTFPLSFTRYKWKKQPNRLEKKGGECWVELSTNNDDDEEQQILDHKCPYNLPEFPQLQLTVKCPDNNEQCATINFCNTESEAIVKTPTHCNDYVGRVLTPWNITPLHNTISIILKITEWRIQVYQEPEENQQSLVADQQCPRGVRYFPYNKLQVFCYDGNNCGQVSSPPTITEYTKLSSSWSSKTIDVMEGKEQETRLTFKDLLNQHWSISGTMTHLQTHHLHDTTWFRWE